MELKNLERVLKALANKRRLSILAYLKKYPEATVGEVASAIHLSIKATSRHFLLLRNADLVDREQRGTEMFYRLAQPIPFVRSITSFL